MRENAVIADDVSVGIEHMSARFRGFSFSPHRHDCYAVGVTTAGAQCFSYRGAARTSIVGQAFVLHPDERHDGREGDERGFGYRIAYVDPALIREAIDGVELPFVSDPVSGDEMLVSAVSGVLEIVTATNELGKLSSISTLAQVLIRLSGQSSARRAAIDRQGVAVARSFLIEHCADRVSLSELEAVVGMSRWQLSRQFQDHYGVSPYRYHLMRRLARARTMIADGSAIVEVATACGFADQSHLNRQFRAAFGVSPGQWKALVG